MNKISEKGVSLLEAIVATAIIGIGFVAIFQMVQYSIRSIEVSGERTKATYLSSMIAEDMYSDRNQEKDSKKFFDHIRDNSWALNKCDNTGGSISYYAGSDNNAVDNKQKKWKARLSKDYIKCRPKTSASTDTVDKKTFDIFKICHKGCDVKLTNYFDPIYMGRVEVNLNSSTKKKVLYFQVK